VRTLIITLLVLAGLAVAVDFSAAAVAEYQVSKQLRAELDLAADPSVRINGFPFLTQALTGTYSDIDVHASGLSVGPLEDVAVEATLYDVDAPLGKLMSGTLSSVRADEAEGRVRIKDTDLGRAIGIDDLRLQPVSDEEVEEVLGSAAATKSDEDGQAAVRMVATTDLAGDRTEVIVIALVELADGAIRLTPVDLRLSGQEIGEVTLPAVIRGPLLAAFATTVEPGGLPFTVSPTAVYVEIGSLIVEGTTGNVRLDQAGVDVG